MSITTSWKTPATAMGTAVTGDPGTEAWTDASLSRIDNDSGAFCILQNTGAVRARPLRVYGFGLAADIPAGSTILGIEVNIKRRATTADRVCDDVLYLTDDGTVANVTQRIGSNRATATGWPAAYAYESHGGAADLWGATLTAAMVRAANFGIHLAPKWYSASAGAVQPNIDAISMRVTFEPPPVTGNADVTEGPDSAVSSSSYVPALDLDFVSSETPDARLTSSGGVNGTRTNASGVIVAATTPRYDYDTATLALRGVLVEEARTNLLLTSLINGTSLATQNVTVSAVAHTLSFYGTGTVTLSGAATGSLVGSGAYPARSTLTFTPTAGTLTLTVTGSVQFANLEAGAFATSFIATAGASVTRSADVMVMTGTNFSSWYSPTEGSLFTENLSAVASTRLIASISNGTSALRMGLQVVGGGINFVVADTATQANLAIGTETVGVALKAIGAYKLNDFAGSANGGTPVLDTLGSVPTVDRMHIGSSLGTGVFLNGHIRRIRYYNQRLPNAVIQALTRSVTGSAAVVEGNDNAVGAGQVKVQGQANITEAGDTAAAAGETGIPLLTPGGRIAAGASSRLSNRTAAVAPSRLANRIAQ